MRNKVVGIGHPVPLNIWAVRSLWIGPPVIALGKEIVLSARAAWTRRCGHRHWRLAQISLGGFENPLPVDGIYIQLDVGYRPRKNERGGQENECSAMHKESLERGGLTGS